jgi:hypothetical protein
MRKMLDFVHHFKAIPHFSFNELGKDSHLMLGQILQMFCLSLPFNVVSLILVFILRSAVQLERPVLLLVSLFVVLSINHALSICLGSTVSET